MRSPMALATYSFKIGFQISELLAENEKKNSSDPVFSNGGSYIKTISIQQYL